MNDPILLALLAAAAAAGLAFIVHLVGRLRRLPSSEMGDLWTRGLIFAGLALAISVLISGFGRIHQGWWNSGYHLHSDVVVERHFLYMLLGPVALWGVVMLVSALIKPGERSRYRWVAGTIGHGQYGRTWTLLCGIPLLVLLLLGLADLGGGVGAYPAAAWSTMVLLLISLVGLSRSAGEVPAREEQEQEQAPEELQPRPGESWPEAMRRKGFQLTHICTWQATARGPESRELLADGLSSELQQLADSGISHHLVNVADRLLKAASNEDRAAWVRGPDHCGQLETVAALANCLAHRRQLNTVVITSSGAEELASQLKESLPGSVPIFIGAEDKELELDRRVWVVDANQLSDRLLPKMSTRRQAADIGLVVWWNLQEYSGVYAANMWAISRRLHRILTSWGRLDAATLAFSRKTVWGHGQAQDFIARMLPTHIPPDNVVDLDLDLDHPVHLYRLDAWADAIKKRIGEARMVNLQFAHPELLLALSSVEAGWRTALEPSPAVTVEELNHFRKFPVESRELRDRLAPSPGHATVRITFTEHEDILSLVERVSKGGRLSPSGTAHHVAVLPPFNPYARWLLDRLTETGKTARPMPGSRRLVGAESNPDLIKRHLLKALVERPDTHERLLNTFWMKRDVIKPTLLQLAHGGKLKQDEVRYLNSQEKLVMDQRFRSLQSSDDLNTSLDSVGLELIEVRELAGGARKEGVRMRVDPERLAIQAYPGRIFLAEGIRYRVREWENLAAVKERGGWVECVQEGTVCRSYRNRSPEIYDAKPQGQPSHATRHGIYISRQAFEVQYRETVLGTTRIYMNVETGEVWDDQFELDAIEVSIKTRGVLINLPQDLPRMGIVSLCECLRIVLPVHLGIDDDAVAIVPMFDENLGGVDIHGLFLVDLYSGGIGLVDAFQDDDALWLDLLEYAHEWLSACSCQDVMGCHNCLHWLPSKASQGDSAQTRSSALALLEQLAPLERQQD